MNILEEENPNNTQLQQCKIAYLKEENQWMLKEQEFINDLIFKYKQIIALNGEDGSEDKVEKIRQEIKKDVEKKQKEYESIKNERKEIEEDISDEEFFTLVGGFEEKIMRLQQNIKDREIQLQEVEEGKNQEAGLRTKKIHFRYMDSVETNRKLIEKVKSEVNKLKLEKKKLENQLLLQRQGNQELKKPSKQRRTIVSEEQQMSTFQKVIMMIKKKRFANEMMEQKISKLKNKIASKKETNTSLKKEIQKMEWGCFESMQGCNGYMDSSYAAQDISILDRTFMNNNISFSFDISRFIRPK